MFDAGFVGLVGARDNRKARWVNVNQDPAPMDDVLVGRGVGGELD